jgi:DNA-binding response OmpR family regulator
MAEVNLLEGKKILIVDDEPDILDTLEDLLANCQVERADNFAAAKKLLEANRYDLAILDIMGVDGYELLKIAGERKVTAVMLTAHALSPDNVARSYKEGAAFYIPKEEMVNIASFLEDILQAQQRGRNTWERWLDRLGAYCERHFGPDWQKGDRIFWEKFPFH